MLSCQRAMVSKPLDQFRFVTLSKRGRIGPH